MLIRCRNTPYDPVPPTPHAGCPVALGWLILVLTVAFRALPGVAADFPEVFDTQQETTALTPPHEALRQLRLPPGFHATMAASEPDVRNPIALAFDPRGRLWVAENYTYAEASVNFETRLRDRVLIFEDRDGDGRFEDRRVFWDGARKLTSVEVGFGGVWLLCPPALLFLPDRDGDDQPDGPPEVVLDGFDADRIRHNFANGLKWGPDGWLYGRHGITTSSFVGSPGAPAAQRIELNCSLWRFHPVRRTFQVVSRGGTNPWGHDWDDWGELFYINTVIGHLWHAVPGTYSQRMFGEHGDPYLYGLVSQTADHFHWDTRESWNMTAAKGMSSSTAAAGGGHAHSGLLIYQGDNWPASYRGRVLTVNLHGHRLNTDRLERAGAGYVGRHDADFAFFDDPWFRGIELATGADGGVFLLDWSDIGECHENDGVHRGSGRIYKVTYGVRGQEVPSALDLTGQSDAQLVALQFHRNEWFVRQARRVLQERAAGGANLAAVHHALHQRLAASPDAAERLRALWALFVTGGAEDPWLAGLARDDADEHVRAWAWRLLFDAVPGDITTHFQGGTPTARGLALPPDPSLSAAQAAALPILRDRARVEPSGLVRLHLASLLQKLPRGERLAVAEGLVADERYADDPMLARLIWYGLQPVVGQDPGGAVDLLTRTRPAFVRRALARRVTTELERAPGPVERMVRWLGVGAEVGVQEQVLEGMTEAVRGWRKATPPPAWAEVGPLLTGSVHVPVARLARELAVVFGDGRAMEQLKETLLDRAGDLATRQRALEALVQTRADGLVPLFLGLLNDHDLAPAVVRGLAACNPTNTAELLVRALPSLYPPGRAEAINTLSSRPAWALALLEAVRTGAVARQEVPAFNVRQMRSLEHPDVNQRLDALWPPSIRLSADREAHRQRLKARLSPAHLAAADLAQGREHFRNLCGACHRLNGEGAAIGPDLTGSDRRNLDYLLENILDPSALVAADYRVSVVELKDGQILNGLVGAQTERMLELQTPTAKLTLERAEIVAVEASELSLMPEGLLDSLPEDQVRDLLGYLMR